MSHRRGWCRGTATKAPATATPAAITSRSTGQRRFRSFEDGSRPPASCASMPCWRTSTVTAPTAWDGTATPSPRNRPTTRGSLDRQLVVRCPPSLRAAASQDRSPLAARAGRRAAAGDARNDADPLSPQSPEDQAPRRRPPQPDLPPHRGRVSRVYSNTTFSCAASSSMSRIPIARSAGMSSGANRCASRISSKFFGPRTGSLTSAVTHTVTA